MKVKRSIFLILIALALLTAPCSAWFTFQFGEPIDSLLDNSAVDIIYDGTYIWLGTGNGLSGTIDAGATWRTFNQTNAFKQSSISALLTDRGRLWASTSHTISSETGETDAGGGLAITDDFGDHWHLVEPRQLTRPGMLAYDLAAKDSAVWAACYYGGLLRSLDRGESWENVFISQGLKNDYNNDLFDSLAGRYFSVIIDPYHHDTVIVWAGSAEGVQRIYYISKRVKLAGNRITDIAYDGDYWWYGTDRGLSRLDDSLLAFTTYDSSNGFVGNFISAVGAENDLVCIGIYDTLAQSSLGFMVSTDGGTQWQQRTPAQAVGSGKMIEEITVHEGDIWATCNQGGFIRSDDGGLSWRNYYLDSNSTSASNPVNIFHCLDLTLRAGYSKILAGTDSGIVVFYFTDLAILDSTRYISLFDSTDYGQKIVSIASIELDSTEEREEIWAAAHPLKEGVGSTAAILRSIDGGISWQAFMNESPAPLPLDIEIGPYINDTGVAVWVATSAGLRRTVDFGENFQSFFIRDTLDFPFVPEVIVRTAYSTAVELSGRMVHVGTLSSGGAMGLRWATDWIVHRAQVDPDSFDFVGRSVASDADTALGGNFIPALGLQRNGDSTIIWASTRPTGSPANQVNGISRSSNRGQTWAHVLNDVQVWNFDFNGDTVFAAASEGLFISTDIGQSWGELKIKDPVSGRSIDPEVEIYGVRLINGVLWVGTADGIAKSADGDNWEIIRTFFPIAENAADEERTYASPNPFSPFNTSGGLKIHYRLANGGDVTIKIYDFANNLVKTVSSGVPREAAIQYDDFDVWDGRNERGDVVAAGLYIYSIESSKGDKLWGKLMVIP